MPKTNINFEDFTTAALASATKALTDNPHLFPNPEITVGIVIRRHYHVDVPDLDTGPVAKL